jgi:sulfite reductase (ferredoxin)
MPIAEFIPLIKSFQLPKDFKIFDRYGERAKRLKARLKFLKEIGKDEFFTIGRRREKRCHCIQSKLIPLLLGSYCSAIIKFQSRRRYSSFEAWKKSNVIRKTSGLCGHRNQSTIR